MAAVPATLVFVQPDFGTAQVYGYVAIAMLILGGCRWLHMGILIGTLTVLSVLVLWLLPSIGVNVLEPYQVQRLTGFVDPSSDPQGANYHARQSRIAIGAGRLTGRSREEASQVGQAFLPEPQTDFIFATLGERHGFIGGATLLLFYGLMLQRILRAVAVSPSRFGQLVAAGVGAMIAAQVFINVGMNIGIMPITGVPLPLFSYGGSAMVATMTGLGLVFGILRSAEAAPVRYAKRRSTVHKEASARSRVGAR
jgi:rod shape determining protein RodA